VALGLYIDELIEGSERKAQIGGDPGMSDVSGIQLHAVGKTGIGAQRVA
jgi:hypothetical protein